MARGYNRNQAKKENDWQMSVYRDEMDYDHIIPFKHSAVLKVVKGSPFKSKFSKVQTFQLN